MNKAIFKTLLAIIFTLVLIPIISNFDIVLADSQTSYDSSSIYQVAEITNNGDFSVVGEYDSFDQAKSVMKTNNDYVVRCKYGYSPTKIVAMNSGLVYSYPRGSSATQEIYEDWGSNKFNRTITYVSRRYEMTYIDTPYMSSKSGFDGQGYVEVILNGFQGFADVEYTDLIPSKFIDKGISIYVGGPYSGNSNSAAKTIIVPNYYVINKNGNYYDLEYHYHLDYPNDKGVAQEYKIVADNASNYTFMTTGTHYFSDDGFNFYTDYKKTNYVGTCYNYYQFLPIRTKTKISASTLDSFLRSVRSDYSSSVINGKGNVYIDYGDEYGCNGTLVYALSCQESSYGTSDYAKYRYNLFGWNAHDDSPGDASYFSSVDNAIKEHMGINLRKYADYTDGRYNGTYVGNKGSGFNLKYASDPYWGMQIAAIYYRIDKFDNNNNGNLTDHNSWNLGLIKTFGAGIYSNAECTNKICNANYTSTRQVANIVSITEDEGNSYKIQFSNPINKENRQVYANQDGFIGYSWSGSYAFVKKSDITLLNVSTKKEEIPNKEYTHEGMATVSNVKLDGSNLLLEGVGLVTNVNFDDASKVTHNIVIKSFDGNNVYTIAANNIESKFNINDGFNYMYAGYSAQIDLTKLNMNSYIIELQTKIDSYDFTNRLSSTSTKFRRNNSTSEGLTYNINANQLYNYRLELDILSTPIDYLTVNKPYEKSSLSSYNSLNINEEGVFDIDGYGMIYYLNYDNASSLDYDLYLVSDKDNYQIIDLENYEISTGIQDILSSEYKTNYIGFKKSLDINSLNLSAGKYDILLKVSNGNYIDFIEFTNRSQREGFNINYNGKNYKLVTSEARYHLYLEVTDIG